MFPSHSPQPQSGLCQLLSVTVPGRLRGSCLGREDHLLRPVEGDVLQTQLWREEGRHCCARQSGGTTTAVITINDNNNINININNQL